MTMEWQQSSTSSIVLSWPQPEQIIQMVQYSVCCSCHSVFLNTWHALTQEADESDEPYCTIFHFFVTIVTDRRVLRPVRPVRPFASFGRVHGGSFNSCSCKADRSCSLQLSYFPSRFRCEMLYIFQVNLTPWWYCSTLHRSLNGVSYLCFCVKRISFQYHLLKPSFCHVLSCYYIIKQYNYQIIPNQIPNETLTNSSAPALVGHVRQCVP
jgi:hypothetical protein